MEQMTRVNPKSVSIKDGFILVLRVRTSSLHSTCTRRTKEKENLENKFFKEVLHYARKVLGKWGNCFRIQCLKSYNWISSYPRQIHCFPSALHTFHGLSGCFGTLFSLHSQIYYWVWEHWQNFSLPFILVSNICMSCKWLIHDEKPIYVKEKCNSTQVLQHTNTKQVFVTISTPPENVGYRTLCYFTIESETVQSIHSWIIFPLLFVSYTFPLNSYNWPPSKTELYEPMWHLLCLLISLSLTFFHVA